MPRNTTTKRCSFTGSTNTSTPGIFTVAELHRQRGTFFGRDAAGAAVGDVARRVERAEVAADGHVALFEMEADAGRLQRPAADQVLDRIVAEQAQVAGPAAGADAGKHRNAAAEDADFRQRVEVAACWPSSSSVLPPGCCGRPPRPSADIHHDFRVVLDVQFAGEVLDVHGESRVKGREPNNYDFHRRKNGVIRKGRLPVSPAQLAASLATRGGPRTITTRQPVPIGDNPSWRRRSPGTATMRG